MKLFAEKFELLSDTLKHGANSIYLGKDGYISLVGLPYVSILQ